VSGRTPLKWALILRRLRLALPLALVVLLVDCTTKEWAAKELTPERVPRAVVGDVVRLTLAYNDGLAMGIPIPMGDNPRWILATLGFAGLAVVCWLMWKTPHRATGRRIALGLILGGAMGNLLSRVSVARGVVDFIDLGIGAHRFWIFNVADIGVMTGAVLLAWSLGREQPESAPPAAPAQ
jgi:signal peptidase II